MLFFFSKYWVIVALYEDMSFRLPRHFRDYYYPLKISNYLTQCSNYTFLDVPFLKFLLATSILYYILGTILSYFTYQDSIQA